VLNVNGKDYKCYLLDANIIISLLKDRDNFGSKVMNLVLADGIFVFTATTLWEVAVDKSLFEDFKNVFLVIPSILILSEDEIVKKESKNYYNSTELCISDVGLYFNQDNFKSIGLDVNAFVDKHVSSKRSTEYKNYEKDSFHKLIGKADVGFMKQDQYQNQKIVASSINLLAYQWIAQLEPELAISISESQNELDVTRFPSLLSKSYIYHYKFMFPNRKGEASDLSDILVVGALPYVDCYLTENSVANNIREIKHKYGFFKKLQVYVSRDINKLKS
jgi:hypothetical protein